MIRQRIQSEIYRLLLRRRGVISDITVRFIGRPLVTTAPQSVIEVGARVRIVSDSRRTALGVNHPAVLRTLLPGARLIIGSDVGISGGSICAAKLIEIGEGTMLGANVTIADTDFHPLDHHWRRYEPIPKSRTKDAIKVGRNVFIGTGAVILKGSSIGDNCVVGAGAVVKGHFPSDSVIAGNPARVIRPLVKQSDQATQ